MRSENELIVATITDPELARLATLMRGMGFRAGMGFGLRTGIQTGRAHRDFTIPFDDEDGDVDPETPFYRTQLGAARHLGIPEATDYAASVIHHEFFPHLTATAIASTPGLRYSLTNLAKLIEQVDPEDRATEEAVDAARAGIHLIFPNALRP